MFLQGFKAIDTRRNLYFFKFPRFLVCTWNVNGQEPVVDLRSWFVTEDGSPDVIAVGFQELDLSAEAFMGRDSKREAEWLEKVRIGVNQVGQYKKVWS